jgi:diguanylate cyclase (GGDEF)-like protein
MPHAGTILLAELDSVSTQLLLFILQRAGFEVLTAAGGEDLVRQARRRRVDLIVSEVLLPDADGLDVCRQLREDWHTRFIPVVLLTAFSDPEYRVRGLLAGADDYITKPFDSNELVLRLRRLIETYRACFQYHPLTRLPGVTLIQAYLSTVCLHPQAGPWAYLHVDLNHFRAFNQLYGYEAGDAVLRMTGDLLREAVFAAPGAVRFAGHRGADDFALVVPGDEADAVCQALISRFDACVLDRYPPEHRETRYQMLIDRRGNVQSVPRLALSIGVVTSDLCRDISCLELEEIGWAVMQRAKREEQSSSYVNRRQVAGRRASQREHPELEPRTPGAEAPVREAG